MHFHAPSRRCFAYGDGENSAAVWNKFWQLCRCLLLLFVSALVRCWYSLANWMIEWTIKISISTDWSKSKFVNTSNLYQQTSQLPSHFSHVRNKQKITPWFHIHTIPSLFETQRFAKQTSITTLPPKKKHLSEFLSNKKSPGSPIKVWWRLCWSFSAT